MLPDDITQQIQDLQLDISLLAPASLVAFVLNEVERGTGILDDVAVSESLRMVQASNSLLNVFNETYLPNEHSVIMSLKQAVSAWAEFYIKRGGKRK